MWQYILPQNEVTLINVDFLYLHKKNINIPLGVQLSCIMEDIYRRIVIKIKLIMYLVSGSGSGLAASRRRRVSLPKTGREPAELPYGGGGQSHVRIQVYEVVL
jgi:hypothetical protein